MDDLWEVREFRSMAYGEFAFIALACLFAAFQWWSMFAISALLCVLTPLWMIVLCVAISAARDFANMENSTE